MSDRRHRISNSWFQGHGSNLSINVELKSPRSIACAMYKEAEWMVVNGVAAVNLLIMGISRLGSRWALSPTPIAF